MVAKIRTQAPHLDRAPHRHPILEVHRPQRRGIVHPNQHEVLRRKILADHEIVHPNQHEVPRRKTLVWDEAVAPVLAPNQADQAIHPDQREIAVALVRALTTKIVQHGIDPPYLPNRLHPKTVALDATAVRVPAPEAARAHPGTEAVADQEHLVILARQEKEARVKALAHRETLD